MGSSKRWRRVTSGGIKKIKIRASQIREHPTVITNTTPGACIIKLITAVIYGFRNKLECLSLESLSSLM